VIDLREIIGDSYADLNRIKGRIIGKNGKTRNIIEETTTVKLSIYGHTVSLIGDIDSVEVAREAIFMLIKGRQHQTVYQYLHRKRRMLKRKEMEIWETKPELDT
jgi:ribosomal RNA assembly protein